MIDKNELLFVVDEENNPAAPLERFLVHKKNLWHRTTGIWVINKKRQILCQKRSMKKDTKPGFWEAFFGGHLHPKETYLTSAVTELSEELGITVSEEELIPYKIFQSDKPTHKEFQSSYLYITNRDDTDFQFEKEEIDQIQWLDFEELKKYLVVTNDPEWVHKPWDEEILRYITQLVPKT